MSVAKSVMPFASSLSSTVIGQIVSVNDAGQALVDFPENTRGPLLAKSALNSVQRELSLPASVVLMFEDKSMACPVITNLIGESLFPDMSSFNTNTKQPELELSPEQGEKKQSEKKELKQEKVARVDGKTVVFNAEQEIQLNCGKASILLKRNGKIVIKGAQVLSRSTGSNKIKGSSVNIN